MSALADWARFPEDDLVPASALQARARRSAAGRAEPWIGALVAALAYLLVGVAIVPRYGAMVDSVARAANSLYVLFTRDPHLGAIGFVWMPLPSLLALPLVALKALWPGLVQDAVALNIISALFGGIAVFFMLRLLRRLDLPAPARWAIALLFALNPAVVFYATNGMTDLMLAATLLGVVDGLWAYLDEGYASRRVAWSGLWLAIGFLIRYEITFWALVVAVALALSLGRLRRHERPALRYRTWMAGLLLVWMTPLFYVVALWIFLNWTIMHDPLYFQRGAYGNAAAMSTGSYAGYRPLDAGHGHIGAALAFVAHQTLLFPPVVVGILGLLTAGLAGRHPQRTRALVLVAATLGLPLFHLTQVYVGNSSGWLRLFLTFVPFGFVAVAYVARLLTAVWGERRLPWLVCIMALAAGNGASGYELLVPAAAPSRFEPLEHFMAADRVAGYLNAHPRLTVLADSWQTFPILVSLHQPGRIVTTSDYDFKAILEHPLGRVDAFLVPQPTGAATLDAINRQYPGLWAHGVPWAHLMASFPGGDNFRLYTIGAPGRARPAATHTPAVVLTMPDIATFAVRQRKGQRYAIWRVRHAVHVWLQGHRVASSGAARVPAGASWLRLVASNDLGSRQRLLHLASPVPPAPPRPRPTAPPTPRPTVRPMPQPSRRLIARPTAAPRPTATSTPRPTATPTRRPTRTPTPASVTLGTTSPTALSTPPAVPTPRPTKTPTPVSVTIGSTAPGSATTPPVAAVTATPTPVSVTCCLPQP